jgi:hypothetical protein
MGENEFPEMVPAIINIFLAFLFISLFILHVRKLELFILVGVMLIFLELYRFSLRHKNNVRLNIGKGAEIKFSPFSKILLQVKSRLSDRKF